MALASVVPIIPDSSKIVTEGAGKSRLWVRGSGPGLGTALESIAAGRKGGMNANKRVGEWKMGALANWRCESKCRERPDEIFTRLMVMKIWGWNRELMQCKALLNLYPIPYEAVK